MDHSSSDDDDDLDLDYSAKPRGILKSRSARPVRKVSKSYFSLLTCSRRRPAAIAPDGTTRPDKRVTFTASVNVSEFAKAIGRDGVPADGTDLAVGLGRQTWQGLAPLARLRHRKNVDTLTYVSIDQREQMLKASMGRDRFTKIAALHRSETVEVKRLRAEALEDTKEPRELMPTSYQQGRSRALKVEAEVRDAAASFDSLATSFAMANFDEASLLVAPAKRKRELSDDLVQTACKVVCLEADVCRKDGQLTDTVADESRAMCTHKAEHMAHDELLLVPA